MANELFNYTAKQGLFVAIYTYIAKSKDGNEWEVDATADASLVRYFITRAKGLFYCGGASPLLGESSDLVTWVDRSSVLPIGTTSVDAFSYFNGNYYGKFTIGVTGFYKSPTLGSFIAIDPTSVGFTGVLAPVIDQVFVQGDSLFVTGTTTDNGDEYTQSFNGTSFTSIKSQFGTDILAYFKNLNNSLYVGLGNSPAILAILYTSSDGLTWTSRTITSPGANSSFSAAGYANGLYYAIGNGDSGYFSYTSPTGVTWTKDTAYISTVPYLYGNFGEGSGGSNGRVCVFISNTTVIENTSNAASVPITGIYKYIPKVELGPISIGRCPTFTPDSAGTIQSLVDVKFFNY